MTFRHSLRGSSLFRIALALLVLCAALPAAAQVTTGSLSGLVVDQSAAPVPGATVTAVHTPTGTVYTAVTQSDGGFRIPNVRVGGPYTVTTTLPGFKEQQQGGVLVSLGQDTYLTYRLEVADVSETITVEAETSALISPTRAGTVSNVDEETIASLPTISRGIEDFARLNPLFTQSASNEGQTFVTVAGRNNRYNNIQIDGAVNNDLFGLAASGVPGGQTETQPISLDAVQEIQLLVSPYDVRQGVFSGGGLNVITKSGSNRFSGTAYYFFRNDGFVGNGVDNTPLGTFKDKQYGASLGGPIVQDKAFFFANVDFGRKDQPSGFSIGGSGQQFGRTADAQRFVDILQSQYGYSNGGLDEFTRGINSDKIFARVDFNLSPNHQLTLRHNYINALNDIGSQSFSFYRFPDNFYRIEDKTNSTVVQLNSRFGSGFNELRLTYQTIRDQRAGPTEFPTVTVRLPDGGQMQTGREQFSTANKLDQDIFELTDDFTMIKGAHTLTIGTHNEFFSFDNLFIRDFYGAYQFASLDNLEAGFAQAYDHSFSATSNPLQSAKFGVNQIGFYVGDTWRVAPRWTLILGIRADIPLFPDKPSHNPDVQQIFGIDTSEMPSGKVLWSPRVGFNWDVTGDSKNQLRGGIGVFSGRTPYVWMSNQYANTGLEFTRIGASFNNANRIPFVTDPLNQPTTVVGAPGRSFTNEVNLIDPDYKFPSVLRFNIAYDRDLGLGGLVGSASFDYGKTLKDILYQNLNLVPSGQVLPGGRPIMTQIDRTYSSAIYLTNTDEGKQWNTTLRLERPFKNGLYLSGSYTYGRSESINDGTSSQASSNWRFLYIVDPNNPGLGTSNFDIRHRINFAASYFWKWSDSGLGATFSLFYNRQSGRPYSTTYTNDVNNDFNDNDLFYVPASADEVVITNGTWDQLNAYIESDEGLRDYRGQIVPRNSSRDPWFNLLDLRAAVDIPISRAKGQFTVDVLNFLNMLNSDWGVIEYSNFNEVSPVIYGGLDEATGKMIYNISPISGGTFNKFRRDDLRSRWQLQLGFRLQF